MTSEAWSYYPTEKASGGDAWFTNSDVFEDTPEIGSYSYALILHETGHTVGLKHSFESGSFGTVPIKPVNTDSLEYSVMSYSSYEGALDWLTADNDSCD